MVAQALGGSFGRDQDGGGSKAAAQSLVSPSWSQGNLMITVDN